MTQTTTVATLAALLGACLPPTSTPPAGESGTVEWVIDGDTVDVRGPDGTEERVRVIGIDTPEREECGYAEAANALADLVEDREVVLVPGARDDRDRYDRLLRYLDVDGTDAGLHLIEQGLAVARYDSRDGHGRHDREDDYIAADAASQPSPCR
ncbi:MAG TPA: thermonuclease family protein [Egicoccus sp.]|nr:thermonuclease family protein [Egicoccus sp.]HSK22013.1 thermonuclease family protein [Egicoccus sp.]